MRQVIPLPFEVHPLIKLCRWSLLLAGAIYGFRRRKEVAIIAEEFRIADTKIKAERAKIIAEERAIANAAELIELERIFLGDNNTRNEMNEE